MCTLFRALFNLLFGCHHRRLSWPLTLRQPRMRTYVVCLVCGAEFDYDFRTMRICRPTAVSNRTKDQHQYAS